ncbi:hypothetical protein BDZ45DRAFT_270022 [Acephala macrosclerotiorum]|nr:hypothetical protein BDZ45DRAFT_270022 [Acephala macrosclerotiorum]
MRQHLLYFVGRDCKKMLCKAVLGVWFEISFFAVILAGAIQSNVRRRCSYHVQYQPFLNRPSISTSWSSTKACGRLDPHQEKAAQRQTICSTDTLTHRRIHPLAILQVERTSQSATHLQQ